MARIPTAPWRGTTVSQDMIAPLDALAATVKPLVTPIPGYGSYRANVASGGVDTGSGHLDVYAGAGWTQADRDEFVANGRRMGFMVMERPPRWWSPTRKKWLTETWAHHFHLVLKDSPDLSAAARTQLVRWYAGSNGLVGDDPDTGPRTYLRQTWSQYLASIAPKPAPASKETTNMALTNDDLKKIWMSGPVDIIEPPNPTKDNPTWAPASILKWTIRYALNAANDAAAARRDAAATLALVKALAAKPGGLSAAETEAAAKSGAAAALDERIRDADVTLNVTP